MMLCGSVVLRVLLMCDETRRTGRSYSMGSLAIRQDRSTRSLLTPTSVLAQYPLPLLRDPFRRLAIPFCRIAPFFHCPAINRARPGRLVCLVFLVGQVSLVCLVPWVEEGSREDRQR
jgi:hypothetical protein